MLVEIEQVFFHCPKAFMRSQLWQPESWKPEAVLGTSDDRELGVMVERIAVK